MNKLGITICLLVFVCLILLLKNYEGFEQPKFETYLLNLDRSKDRLEHDTRELNKYSIHFKRVDGVDGSKYQNKYQMMLENGYSPNFCMNGKNHIGCYLSHLKAIKEFYNSSSSIGMFLEDDFKFIDNPNNYLDKFIKMFDDNETDIIWLMDYKPKTKPNTVVKEMKSMPTWNGVGYMLNKKSAGIFVRDLTPDSDFLKKYYSTRDCLFDFAIFKCAEVNNIRYKWFTLLTQNTNFETLIDVPSKKQAINNFEDFVDVSEYKFDKCEHAINLGDTASQQFIEQLFDIKFANKDSKKVLGSVLTIGSILTYSRPDTIVWGSGFISSDSVISKDRIPRKIYSVRGPRTYNKLIEQGIKCPEVFGDPFFVVPLLHQPIKNDKPYQIGIIPHYSDKNSKELSEFTKKFRNERINIIDIQTTDIQKFVNEISKCERVYSSSLHGIIISLAYDIPTIWLKLSNKLVGGDFKFYDFLESLDIKDYHPGSRIVVSKNNKLKLGIEILSSCPFIKNDKKQLLINQWKSLHL